MIDAEHVTAMVAGTATPDRRGRPRRRGDRRGSAARHLPPDIRELTESLIAGITHEMESLRQEPGSIQAVRVDDAAHMVHLDTPYTVGRLIREFVLAQRDHKG